MRIYNLNVKHKTKNQQRLPNLLTFSLTFKKSQKMSSIYSAEFAFGSGKLPCKTCLEQSSLHLWQYHLSLLYFIPDKISQSHKVALNSLSDSFSRSSKKETKWKIKNKNYKTFRTNECN